MTPREADVLDTLTRRVRLLTLEQLGELLRTADGRPVGLREARRLVDSLAARGLVRAVSLVARPPLPIRAPEIVWSPGDPTPDFERAAYRLQRRWKCPPRSQACVVATGRAHNLHGTRPRCLKQPLQASHDLGLANVYLRYRDLSPSLAATWRHEDALQAAASKGGRLPDAALCAPDGKVFLALEFGGAYKSERLLSLHRSCASSDTPYQVW